MPRFTNASIEEQMPTKPSTLLTVCGTEGPVGSRQVSSVMAVHVQGCACDGCACDGCDHDGCARNGCPAR